VSTEFSVPPQCRRRGELLLVVRQLRVSVALSGTGPGALCRRESNRYKLARPSVKCIRSSFELKRA